MKTRKASFPSCFYLPLVLLVGLLAFPMYGFASSGDAPSGDGSSADISIYDGSLADADVYIEIPALRQYGGYTCGATCVQMLMNWFDPYAADLNLTHYEELLGTTPEKGHRLIPSWGISRRATLRLRPLSTGRLRIFALHLMRAILS